MGTGRRMFLLFRSRVVCFIVMISSFLSSFVSCGMIRWNNSEEFKAIWVVFALSYCRTVA